MRPRYLIPCDCGKTTPIDAGQAGREIRCECGAMLQVPSLSQFGSLEAAGPSTPEPGKRTRDARRKGQANLPTPRWGRREKWFLLGMVVTVISLTVVAVFCVTRPKLPDVTELFPLGTWRFWQDVRHGIDQLSPFEAWYLDAYAWYLRWLGVWLVTATIGVGIIVASLFMPRKQRKRRKKGPPTRRRRRRSPPTGA